MKPVITSLNFTLDNVRGRTERGWVLPEEILEFEALKELSLNHCKKVPEGIAKRMQNMRALDRRWVGES